MGYMVIGDEQIDIRGLYNITSHAQLAAIAFLIRKIAISNQDRVIFLHEKIKKALEDMERRSGYCIFFLFPGFERWLELPRINEVLSVINRMKHLNSIQIEPLNTSDYDINIDYLDNQIVKVISERHILNIRQSGAIVEDNT